MRPHRPMRALAGAFVVVASVVAALAIYTRVGNRADVLAVSRDVLAGEQIGSDDLAVVSMSSDDGIPTIPASQRSAIVGQYARFGSCPVPCSPPKAFKRDHSSTPTEC